MTSFLTIDEYFGKWIVHQDVTPARYDNAVELCRRVNELLATVPHGTVPINPLTQSIVGGTLYGGFRPQNCKQGAPTSAHKEGMAVDLFDPNNALDDLITDAMLERHNLYREHPADTVGWCHLGTRAPKSGRRTFKP